MPRVRVIVQARTSSARLAGKSLLPVAGYPAAVLAALRASRGSWETVLATSDHPSDDRLARLVAAAGIRVVRGPLDDVLERFTLAAGGLPDDAVVVRLTADNLLPDATLVDEILAELQHRGVPYLCTWSPELDVPLGLSVEAFTAGALRRAARTAPPGDREHVTPWIRRTFARRATAPGDFPPAGDGSPAPSTRWATTSASPGLSTAPRIRWEPVGSSSAAAWQKAKACYHRPCRW